VNYATHYERLVDRARTRPVVGYVERHHVVPKCLGGSNAPENIVRLTPEEHYVAHQLLVKMHPGNHRLVWAAAAMTNQTQVQRRGNKLYGWLRRLFAERIGHRNRGRTLSAEQRQQIGDRQRGKPRGPFSAEHRRKISEASKRYVKTPAHRAAMSAARMGKKRGPHSAEHRRRMSESIKVALMSSDRSFYAKPEYKARQSESMKQIWAQRKAAGKRLMPTHGLPVGG
jgi:Salmonella phage homing endonuclease